MTNDNIHAEANPRNDVAASPREKWKRRFERGIPKGALTWSTARQRSIRMFGWQCAVTTKFASSARAVRIAWLLSLLCQKEGYAFCTDDYISKTLGIPVNKVQQALTELERAGAIIRASSFVHGKPQRRIWPATKIMPPTAGGMDAPRNDRVDTPRGGGTDSIERPRSRKAGRISSTAEAAKLDAERRERRAQEALGRPVDDVIEGEILDLGVAGVPPPNRQGPIVVQIDGVPDGLVIDPDGVEYRPPPPYRRSPVPRDWIEAAFEGMGGQA